jgi:hypothetical protein
MKTKSMEWSVNTVCLLQEICNNPGTAMLKIPLNIFKNILAEVAERAIELDDKKLNILMLRLWLYECTPDERMELIEQLEGEY